MTNASAEIKATLARIAKEDAYLNSFVRIFEFAALRDAKELHTAAVNDAPHAPLSGLPVGVKDNFAVQGTSWTAGIKGRHDFVAERDATAVARLRTGGAILLGALNMDEAAFGAVTDNPVFGRCMNPLRNGFSPGGSSGGSAAAVAAGFIDLALGSNTLCSVRIPAAYCGVVGRK
ncbi:MAG: amidase family protein, partial [Paracoccaceae bacterium]